MQLRDRYIRESETHAFIIRKRGDVSQVISKEVRQVSHHLLIAVIAQEIRDLDAEWRTVSDRMTRWSHKLENHLPGRLTEIVRWLLKAESMLSANIRLDQTQPQKTHARLEGELNLCQNHLADSAQRYAHFYSIYRTGKVDGRPVPMEFLDPINVRFMLVRDRSPNHIARLRWLMTHYRIYAELRRLELRAQKWQRPESIQQAIDNAKECEVLWYFLLLLHFLSLIDVESAT